MPTKNQRRSASVSSKGSNKSVRVKTLSKSARKRARQKLALKQKEEQIATAMALTRRSVNNELARVSGSAMGIKLTKMMMLPSETQEFRIPTAEMPPVAITKLRKIDDFVEPITETLPLANYSVFMVNYGQPSLTYMSGPHYSGIQLEAFTYFDADPLSVADYAVLNSGTQLTRDWYLKFDPDTINSDNPETLNAWWPLSKVATPGGTMGQRPILVQDGVPFMFLSPGENIYFDGGLVTVTEQSVAQGALMFTVHRLKVLGEDPEQVADFAVQIDGAVISPISSPWMWTTGGWYAFRIDSISHTLGEFKDIAVRLRSRLNPGNGFYELHYMPELSQASAIGNNARRTASTLLVTNTSAPLVAQGDVIATRLHVTFPGFDDWQNLPERISSAKQKYGGKAAKGCYTYMELSSKEEQFADFVNQWGAPIVRPETMNMVNVITISNANRQTSPNTYMVISDMVIEFRSESQLYATAVSSMPYLELIEARRINNMTDWFYENPLHWKDIMEYINRAWKWTRSHSTALGVAASAVFPEAAPMILPVARALQS